MQSKVSFYEWMAEQIDWDRMVLGEDLELFWLDSQIAFIKGILGTSYKPVKIPVEGFDKLFESCRKAAIRYISDGLYEREE